MPRVLAALLLALAACAHSSPPPAQPPTNLSGAQPTADTPSTTPLRFSGRVHHDALAAMPDEGLYQGNAPQATDLKIGLLRDAATFDRFVTAAKLSPRVIDTDVDFDANLVISVVLDRETNQLKFADTTVDAGTATVTIELEDIPPHHANVRPAVLASVPRAGLTTVIVKLATGETIGSIAVR